MTMPLPVLDDRTFDDLVREALAHLPAYAPEWTNHNASDPGITLVELFAYFTEILLYRIGRIPPASKLQFLRLLTGAGTPRPALGAEAGADAIGRAISDAVRELSQIDCAVTGRDFERLAEGAAIAHMPSVQPFRALCMPGMNLEHAHRGEDCRASKAHVSVVIVPAQGLAADALADLCAAVRQELLPRCLIATRLHVSGAVYLQIGIGAAVVARPGWDQKTLLPAVAAALRERFGYAQARNLDGEALPLGRPLYLSEIIAVIDQVDGIDYVTDVTLLQMGGDQDGLTSARNGIGLQIGVRSTLGSDCRLGGAAERGSARLVRGQSGSLLGILLKPWELPDLVLTEDAFVVSVGRGVPGHQGGVRHG